MPELFVPASTAQAEITVTRSRFIAQLAPAPTVADADAVIRAARAAHPAARHHGNAMIIEDPTGPVQRSHDDGEPSGTTGMPILLALQGAHLVDAVCVVTRYFGGTKLGTGGLARAYGDAASAAIDAAVLLCRRELDVLQVRAPHAEAGALEHALRLVAEDLGAVIQQPIYAPDHVLLEVLSPPASTADIRAAVEQASAGALQAERAGTRVVDS